MDNDRFLGCQISVNIWGPMLLSILFFFFVTVKAHLCVFEIRMFAAEKPRFWGFSECILHVFPWKPRVQWMACPQWAGQKTTTKSPGGQLAEDLRSSLRRRWVDLNIREELHVLYCIDRFD